MSRQAVRVVVGGIIGVVVLTAFAIAFTSAGYNQSLTFGLIGGSIIATVNWLLEEQRKRTS